MNNRDSGNANIGIGFCVFVIGLFEWMSASGGRPTGRWSFLLGPMFDQFGNIGPSVVFLLVGGLLIVFGFFLRGKK